MPAVVVLAGAHLAETVGLDLDDLPTTQRRCRLRVRGQGRRNRSVPVRLQPAVGLDACSARRRTWPGADPAAVFLNRAGARLPLRTADEIIRTIVIAPAWPTSSGVARLTVDR